MWKKKKYTYIRKMELSRNTKPAPIPFGVKSELQVLG